MAHKTGALASRDLERVVVDTTVQPKAIAHPTDARLCHRALEKLVDLARHHQVPLRQSYRRLAKRAAIMVGRYMHAHQFKRARRELKFLRIRLGRVIRGVRRTIAIEPDWRIASIRLSDKTSRLHPRHVAPKRGQTHEPEVPVKVREWIGPALTSPDPVLDAQPPAQPHSSVVVDVDRPIRFGDGAYIEVVRPSAQRAVQHAYQLCGFLPRTCSDSQLVDLFDHALDALL